MALSRAEVENIAQLARLTLTEEEKALYQQQLSEVLAYAERLNELELGDVPPTAYAVPRQNVMRDDVARPALPVEDVLFNAPQQANNQFLIQTVLED
ncbi:MAG: Asp-tRNA(Asn)/Glu-tRNA(Gln) amidotransferase subunit GatC [Anaerolineales bacterium]|nr:Asp-tRNA(Asn)/Glu-tRNA(Gln) amidotransferase subunit GatC [Anaerolineales bacterium]MCB0013559.1 Asp-tRNA(Asn)/Glu-tRNA(Gln) amidotransferase subunit GatC [Anaerolineales bacterium]MCB0019054.1 Asp-tRNA(Asn)/Glu-tRNA(Gln) amidotransferase subunit GatC [Anaerolineales bacterium]MCB0032137.1 Asp-tRNA(Asn)/Glu-tRNA(Gln) amidotransferase subunit GatC [Anaerolineales bacterium]MCB8960799.1 Asp-tRNA(Asn)/Glu-tRNA(Gln) amidotransferase subunit GatC [Ardenticatenales bacterium]